MTAQYLRVKPHADMKDLAVPLGGGRRVRASTTPAEGHLVLDSHFIRRRVHFGELVIVAEGADATAEAKPAPVPSAASPAPSPASLNEKAST